jgi:EAL domain-containing protein (putative c-di-GMP-specific phosphodiesterase class I)
LARWQHPRRGLLPPGEFIPVAEASGLIVPLGSWVLRQTCAQACGWLDQGRQLRVAVNVSPAQFRQGGLLATLDAALAATGLDPRLLELEITENLLLDPAPATSGVLRSIAARGVALSIDDFGTGYSSLAYLKRLPAGQIKIDRSFVQGIGKDGESEAVVRAIVTLAHELGKRVVAEGIETCAQLDFLRDLGCDEAQGFLLCRPQPAEALVATLEGMDLPPELHAKSA